MIAIYARQSVDKKDSISIETQIEICQKEIDSKEKVEVYYDKGYSGSNINRPSFQKLLNDIKDGKITKVIIYRLDRMSRSLLDFANLIELFKKYKVEFQSTQEKFDTSTPIGNAMLSITMVFAQLERETIGQRIKDSYYARGKHGAFLGGKIPYGFTNGKILIDQKTVKILEPNIKTQNTVSLIYKLYGEEQHTLGEIARFLNKKNIPSPSGKTWSSSRISMILRNPVYVKCNVDVYQYYKGKGCKILNDISNFSTGNGCWLFGKRSKSERKYTNVEDHNLAVALHKGIIDPDLFLRCQIKLDNNKQIDNSNIGKHSWLTGIVKCKKCGYNLVVKTSYHGRYKYWMCPSNTRGFCNSHFRVTVNYVEDIIKDKIFKNVLINKDIVVHEKQERNEKINEIKIQIEIINQKIDKLIELCSESTDISLKYFNQKIETLDKEKSKLEECLVEINNKSADALKSKQIYDIINEWDKLTNSQRKEITSYFISKIILEENGDIEILWKHNFNDSNINIDYSNGD